jgi:RNA polymerase sigma-70 factor (ECF subfamily)
MPGAMEAALTAAMEQGRRRWPGVVLPETALAQHGVGHSIPEQAVRERGEDLFLATACAAGDPVAIGAFEREFLPHVRSFVGRMALTDEMVDELRQELRVKLLVDRPPRIATYKGAGPLGAWVRVAAVRIGLTLLGAAERNQARPAETLAEALIDGVVPEAELTRARVGPLLAAAVEAAIVALDDRDKAVLRFHYVEGLNVDAIGAIYRVHRATAARWLVDIRQRLLRAVQNRLVTDLRVSDAEVHSLVGAVGDELHLSISRILGGRR